MASGDVKKISYIYGRTYSVIPANPLDAFVPCRVNADGSLVVTTGSSSLPSQRFNSGGDIISAVIKVSPGFLLQIDGFNPLGNPTRFLHIFDSTVVPANGTIPDWIAPPVSGNQTISHFFGEEGLVLGTGISVAVSSTRTTLTAAADMWISARFR